MVQSFVTFIPFAVGDRTQFQIPARSQIFTLVAILSVTVDNRQYIKFIFLVLISWTTFAICSCEPKGQKKFSKQDILGTWYLNEWTLYHTLRFTDTTVFVDNHIDTIFTLKYSVDKDTLRTTPFYDNRQFANSIIKLTKDTLVLDGLINAKERRTYVRIKERGE